MCSFEHNYCASTTVHQVKNPEMTVSASHPICVDASDDHSSLETEVIIESMAAEVPLIATLVEENVPTQHTKETIDIILASNDHLEAEKKSPVTVVDEETTEDYIVCYDELGENITFLKHDAHTSNIEKQISEIWMKDAKEWKWSIPLKRLSKSDIYELSNPPPNWTEMDLYSGIEDVNDEPEPDIPVIPLEENNTVDLTTQEQLHEGNLNFVVSDPQVQQKTTASRYSLRIRSHKKCDTATL